MKDFMKGVFRVGATKGIMALLKNPVTLIILGVLLILLILYLMMTLLIASFSIEGVGLEDSAYESIYSMCTPVEIEDNEEFIIAFNEQFEGKGALEGTGDLFINVAYQNEIDPVLLASISLHETGNGTSSLLVEKNNPGGLYDSSKGEFYSFDSLEEGLDMMAGNLFVNYIDEGLVSISQIGNKYAPIGASNDPNNLNQNWIPNVTEIANEFGGLIMNCPEINFGNGEFAYPIPNVVINSNFGQRIDPLTGLPSGHEGIDFNCNFGDIVYSALEGTVVNVINGCRVGNASCGGTYGNRVLLEHDGYYTLYAHLTEPLVSTGDIVQKAQPVGTCGSTGRSTGAHLHFEVQLSLFGDRIDPTPFFTDGEGDYLPPEQPPVSQPEPTPSPSPSPSPSPTPRPNPPERPSPPDIPRPLPTW